MDLSPKFFGEVFLRSRQFVVPVECAGATLFIDQSSDHHVCNNELTVDFGIDSQVHILHLSHSALVDAIAGSVGLGPISIALDISQICDDTVSHVRRKSFIAIDCIGGSGNSSRELSGTEMDDGSRHFVGFSLDLELF